MTKWSASFLIIDILISSPYDLGWSPKLWLTWEHAVSALASRMAQASTWAVWGRTTPAAPGLCPGEAISLALGPGCPQRTLGPGRSKRKYVKGQAEGELTPREPLGEHDRTQLTAPAISAAQAF